MRNFGVNAAGDLARSNGTSFSAPVISGLAACLWQANPQAGVMDILNVIKESADRYKTPDTLYGYGIPDFNLANILLKRRDCSTGFLLFRWSHSPILFQRRSISG